MNFFRKHIALVVLAGVVALGGVASFVPQVQAATASVVVFLTRLNGIIATYPASNAFSVGTTTTTGAGSVATSSTGIAKLGVTLNPSDSFLNSAEGFKKAFEVASTTTTGGTATTTRNIFMVGNTGCVQLTGTSSATQIKLVFGTVPTTTVSGFVQWSYGTCF